MTVPVLPPEIYGTPLRNGYAQTRSESTSRIPSVGGRARYRLHDQWAMHHLDIQFDLDQADFTGWQAFWAINLNGGQKWFWTYLRLDVALPDQYMLERYQVHALEPYQAKMSPSGRWEVTLRVETPSGVFYDGTLCHVIFAGHITNPADDVIWAGDITDLPPDIIEPCPWVWVTLQ